MLRLATKLTETVKHLTKRNTWISFPCRKIQEREPSFCTAGAQGPRDAGFKLNLAEKERSFFAFSAAVSTFH